MYFSGKVAHFADICLLLFTRPGCEHMDLNTHKTYENLHAYMIYIIWARILTKMQLPNAPANTHYNTHNATQICRDAGRVPYFEVNSMDTFIFLHDELTNKVRFISNGISIFWYLSLLIHRSIWYLQNNEVNPFGCRMSCIQKILCPFRCVSGD